MNAEEKASELAINNVLKEGLTDIFPQPHEIQLLKNNDFKELVKGEVVRALKGCTLESLKVSPLEHVLIPKTSAFDFRRCALIQPLDTIKYLALAILLAGNIEKNRLDKKRKIIFSYRFSFRPCQGYIFDKGYNYTTFRTHVSEKIKQDKVSTLVSCDIANFFDRLNLHRLESILLSISPNESDKKYVRLVNQLLLSWANRDSYGLPVGSNASRILAEAALIGVDNYLEKSGIRFCRFVDDYRFFAPNVQTAHYWLTQFMERLWLEGLAINKNKTKIEDVSHKKHSPKTDTVIDMVQGNVTKVPHQETRGNFRIIAGYGGTIPTKFRQPSKSEIENLTKIDISAVLKKIESLQIVSPEEVGEFLRASPYVCSGEKETESLKKIPDVLEKFPQFTPFAVDMLIKHKDIFPEDIKNSISSYFSKKLSDTISNTSYLPEYLSISIIRLLGTEGYCNPDMLFKYFTNLRRNSGAYVGRAALDAMENLISRGQVIEIRHFFVRADSWEKRQIVRIVSTHLEEDEKRPWLKNIKIQEGDDLFLREIIEPTKPKLKKKRKPSTKKQQKNSKP